MAGLIAGGIVAACGGDDATTTAVGPDSGTSIDAGNGDASSGGVDSSPAAAPTHAAASVALSGDSNHGCSVVTGNVTIARAVDESDVTDYVVYWGSSATTKLGSPIGVVAKTGSNLVHPLANAPRPANATHILAFTRNAIGEMPTGVAVAFDEVGQFVSQDISVGQGIGTGLHPSITIDAANGKLIVATMTVTAVPGPALFRCNLDGTSCTHTDISAGQGNETHGYPRIFVDDKNGKVLVVALNGISGTPELFRCNLDGTACARVDISAGQAFGTSEDFSAAIDEMSGKLLVAARNSNGGSRPGLLRCNLDGTSCTYTDLTTGTGHTGIFGVSPSIVIDTLNAKLLVATVDVENSEKLALFRCNLDGTSCSYTDISAGQGAGSGAGPQALVDTVNHKLLVFSNNGANASKLAMFRCELDGTACSYFDIAAGQTGTPFPDEHPAAALDAAGKKVVVASLHSVDAQGNARPGLFRCNLDGTGCTFSDISPRMTSTELSIAAVWNPASQTLLTVLNGDANLQRPTFVGVCGH